MMSEKNIFKAAVFDMDGTLTVPNIDFMAMRKALELPEEGDIASMILQMPAEQQKKAWRTVKQIEEESARQNRLQPDAKTVLQNLKNHGVKIAVLSRNTTDNIKTFCKTFALEFDCILGRDFPTMKPDPAPLLHILSILRVAPKDAIMVGDYIHDLECGAAAGASSCFFANPDLTDYAGSADYTVSSYKELEKIILCL